MKRRFPLRLRKTLFVLAGVLLTIGVALLLRPVDAYFAAERAILWLRGFEDHYIDIEGHRIHYYEGGANGETVVLVHGLGGRASNWRRLMTGLVRDYHILSIDLLGFGLSDKPPAADYSIRAQADRLGMFLDSKNLSRVNLAGWSMGGWISLDFTSRRPDRVQRLMLISSAGVVFEPGFDPKILHPDNREELLQMLRILPAPIPPGFIQRDLLRSMKEQAWVVEHSLNAMLTGRDALDGRLQAVTMPVLLVWGAEDRLTPLSVAHSMRSGMPHAELVVLEDCGHLAPVLCPGQVLRLLQQFLPAPGLP